MLTPHLTFRQSIRLVRSNQRDTGRFYEFPISWKYSDYRDWALKVMNRYHGPVNLLWMNCYLLSVNSWLICHVWEIWCSSAQLAPGTGSNQVVCTLHIHQPLLQPHGTDHYYKALDTSAYPWQPVCFFELYRALEEGRWTGSLVSTDVSRALHAPDWQSAPPLDDFHIERYSNRDRVTLEAVLSVPTLVSLALQCRSRQGVLGDLTVFGATEPKRNSSCLGDVNGFQFTDDDFFHWYPALAEALQGMLADQSEHRHKWLSDYISFELRIDFRMERVTFILVPYAAMVCSSLTVITKGFSQQPE